MLDWRRLRHGAGREGVRICEEVKLMVVMFSKVGQSGWCQDVLLRAVLCHVDGAGGKIGSHVRTGERRGGGRSRSRSLTSCRLLAPG